MRSTLFAALAVFCFIPTFITAQAVEVYPAVERVREATWTICDRLYITANFRNQPGVTKTIHANFNSGCATAFQVSDTEVLTALHVFGDPKSSLFAFFAKQLAAYQAHKGLTFDRKLPAGDVHVEHYVELISSEGLVLRSKRTTYSVPWGGVDPDEAALARLLEELQSVTAIADGLEAQFSVRYTDEQMDLAYLQLVVPFVRSQYVSVVDKQFTPQTLAWGVNAREPSRYSRGLPGLSLVRASIREVGAVPEASGGTYLDPDIWTYRLTTNAYNTSGVSGGPNVNADGELIGVTHAGGSAEGKMAIFDVRPQCNVPMHDGHVFPCHRYVIAGHFVHQFLEAARAH